MREAVFGLCDCDVVPLQALVPELHRLREGLHLSSPR